MPGSEHKSNLTFGAQLKYMRRLLSSYDNMGVSCGPLTQADLATDLSIDGSLVSHWEGDRKQPGEHYLFKLVEYFAGKPGCLETPAQAQEWVRKLGQLLSEGQLRKAFPHATDVQFREALNLQGIPAAVLPSTPDLPLSSNLASEQRSRYLASLRARLGFVTTHAFIDPTSHKPQRLQLFGPNGAYEPLTFDLESDRTQGGELRDMHPQPLNLAEVLNLGGHLAIIGLAGSGKTTALSIVATCLADSSPVDILPGLVISSSPPVPIYLPLRDFDLACSNSRDQPACYQRTVPDLLRYLDDWFNAGRDNPLPDGFLAAAVRAGRAWLLLDAMDEVPDPANRETIRNRILDLAGGTACVGGTRLIVTARVAAYRGAPLDDRFLIARVRNLSPEQQRGIVRRLYAGLALKDHASRAKKLIERIQAPDFPQELLRTPVEIWTTAIVDVFEGTLPKGRAALYERYADIMLKKKYELPKGDTKALHAWANAQEWNVEDRWQLLTFAAFAAHRWSESVADDTPLDNSSCTSITLELLVSEEILTGYLKKQMLVRPEQAKRKAEAFVALMAEQSGLLVEDASGYRFGMHRIMQEFLAGCYLGSRFQSEEPDGYERFMATAYCRLWWQEVFKLAAGYLFTQKDLSSRIPGFLDKIVEQGATPDERLQTLILAASTLHELNAMVRPPQKPAPQWYGPVWENMTNRLLESLNIDPLLVEVQTRQQAGLLLGEMYGWPNHETRLSRDPRFAHPYALPDFDPVPAGWFVRGYYGSGRPDERPARRIYIDGFKMARYPVTNAMYYLFIKHGGYGNADYWQIARKDGRWIDGQIVGVSGRRKLPQYWDDAHFNNPAQPVVGITWYEAEAYCCWLRAQTGLHYHLPTEAEWEKAACFDPVRNENQIYPWGDSWKDKYCNTYETQLGQPNAIGVFPNGASACGVQDLAGNVWEWCSDVYDASWYSESGDCNPSKSFDGIGTPVVRGGSCSDSLGAARCTTRDKSRPDDALTNIGFRIVASQ